MTLLHSTTQTSSQAAPEGYQYAGPAGKPSYSAEQAALQITRTGEVWRDLDNNGRIDLTYTFLTREPSDFAAQDIFGFSEFGELQKQQAKLSLQSWADVANVTFTEAHSGGEGHLTFGNYSHGDDDSGVAFAYVPGSVFQGQSWYEVGLGDTWFGWFLDQLGMDSAPNRTPGLNNQARQTLTHEIGHNLGLDHPGDYNADDESWGDWIWRMMGGEDGYVNADYAEDSLAYTVMSYWSERNTGQAFSGEGSTVYASAPLMHDIAAIQWLYGANHDTRADDTVYGFNSNTDRDFLSATSSSDKLVFSVWDGGGNDTLDFSGFSQDQTINLNEASFSDVGGLVGNVSIAKGVTLENAQGGSGNDLIIGNAADNWILAGEGDDLLHGGDGFDILYGGEGSDILHGGEGDDLLVGGSDDDILIGGAGSDTLSGGAGRDTFVFTTVSDSTREASDWIMDFVSGEDILDLRVITGGTGLNFVKTLSGNSGEAVLGYDPHFKDGTLEIDFSGNGVVDFRITTIGQVAVTDIVA